jgi:hypothetical protein
MILNPNVNRIPGSLKKLVGSFLDQPIICEKCGKRHFSDDETFLIVYGNITRGFTKGLLGNNFNEKGEVFRIHAFCIEKECAYYIVPFFLWYEYPKEQ